MVFYSIIIVNHQGKDELGLCSTVDLVYSLDPGKKPLTLHYTGCLTGDPYNGLL